jgi:hypothetical protein
VTITTIATAAAPRPRTLSTQTSPFTLPTAGVDAWRDCVPAVGVPTYMRTKSAFRTTRLNHNSIVSTAKQAAAPPRGVPR